MWMAAAAWFESAQKAPRSPNRVSVQALSRAPGQGWAVGYGLSTLTTLATCLLGAKCAGRQRLVSTLLNGQHFPQIIRPRLQKLVRHRHTRHRWPDINTQHPLGQGVRM